MSSRSAGQRKLTITVDADVYEALHSRIGPRGIGRFLSDLARPHVVQGEALAAGYAAMAADADRETEAEAWAEATIGDLADDR